MPGYHQVFICRDYSNHTAGVDGANRICVGVISLAFELDAKMFQATARLPSHRSGSFANAARENQKIESAQRGGERADLLSELIAKHLHRQRSIWCGVSSFEQHPHIGDARYADQSRLMVHKIGKFVRIEMLLV